METYEQLEGFKRQPGDRDQIERPDCPAPHGAQLERPERDGRDAPNPGGGARSRH